MDTSDHDEALAQAIEKCFLDAEAPQELETEAWFDRVHLKLMRLFQQIYIAGYNDGAKEAKA